MGNKFATVILLVFLTLPAYADNYYNGRAGDTQIINNIQKQQNVYIEDNPYLPAYVPFQLPYSRPVCAYGFSDENGVRLRSYWSGKPFPSMEKAYLRWLIRNNCPIPDYLLNL